MQQQHFVLKNNSQALHNDIVFDRLFDLSETAYLFTVQPRTAFWRFGIRLSRQEQILFFHPEHRYREPEFNRYKDLHIGAGDWDNQVWRLPDQLSLTQYNFKSPLSPVYKGHYNEFDALEWYLQYIPAKQSLYVSLSSNGQECLSGLYPLEEDYRFFKIFAWADKMGFELECELSQFSREDVDNSPVPFLLGNVLVRLGDMFNPEATVHSNLFLLPASEEGTVAASIGNRAVELALPPPQKNKAGSVKVFDISDKEQKVYAGYAYSVAGASSGISIIRTVCENVVREVLSHSREVTGINMPLLGTGAGRLDPLEVIGVYEEVFNRGAFVKTVTVSIPGQEMFQRIKQAYSGHYVPYRKEARRTKPLLIEQLEEELDARLNQADYELSPFGEVTSLNLSRIPFFNGDLLERFTSLLVLNISNHQLESYRFLYNLNQLHTLFLSATVVKNYDFLYHMPGLSTLDLSYNKLVDLDFLKGMDGLRRLHLQGNEIGSLRALSRMERLEVLDVSHNRLHNLDGAAQLQSLHTFSAAHNHISSFEELKKLQRLASLDISYNQIGDASAIRRLKKLSYLKANNNPFVRLYELILGEDENHLSVLQNFLLRQAESAKVQLSLPAKVVLLGNHASGKSSLLHYLQQDSLTKKMDSTHIIRIESYPKHGKQIPEAVFFDFGGQDYYHGIYRAFLSGGALYLILWNGATETNMPRRDRQDVLTQDFKRSYWLCQKSYLEKEKFNGISDPVLLIQTYSDRDKKITLEFEQEIDNEFYISLQPPGQGGTAGSGSRVNKKALAYLKESILDLIEKKKMRREEPQWYVDFITYILAQNKTAGFKGRNVTTEVLPHYHRGGADALEHLYVDLDQLHKQGLILYYRYDLPDRVWLNPVALVTYVHDTILNRNILKDSLGQVPFSDFDIYDEGVIRLLQKQKVIYRHEHSSEYIVPNFLPLANEAGDEFDLFTFGFDTPLFVLKFRNFLPFGYINQVICFFGELPDKKKFWRDQLLFTFHKKAKILIKVDFNSLEVKVFGSFTKDIPEASRNGIIKYLFYGLLGLYWDLNLLTFADYQAFCDRTIKRDDFEPGHPLYNKLLHAENIYEKDACRPTDLYISLDGTFFIHYTDLCRVTDQAMINALRIDAERNLTGDAKVIPVFPFQSFTSNALKRKKKAVVSYSKKDLALVNKFMDYMIPLVDDELMDKPWFCSELLAGTDWNEEIQNKFGEADIIFFMVSSSLMATRYVKEYEIKNAIDRWENQRSLKIIPVILEPYSWTREGKYNLGRFAALPYKAIPVTSFPDPNEAWKFVAEAVRIMILKDLDPSAPDFFDNPEIKAIGNKLVKTQ